MVTPLTIGIPVMMSSPSEIIALKAAKERIETATRDTAMPINVGAFLYLTDREATPDNLAKGLENQREAKLPIVHVQAPIYQLNSLAFGGEEAARFGGVSLLETLSDHAYSMKQLSGDNCYQGKLVFETHPGVIVFGHKNEPNPNPATYSKEYFLANRDKIMQTMQERFDALSYHVRSDRMLFSVENGCVTTVEPDRWDPEKKPQFHYLPFDDLESLKSIAGVPQHLTDRFLTFDIAHLATAQNIGKQMRENGTDAEAATFLSLYGKSNWAEYDASVRTISEHLANAAVLHLSNASGIGMKLGKTPDIEAKWGKDGGLDGLLSAKQMRDAVVYARDNKLPVMFELAYDLKTIPTKQFRDVDDCLAYIGKA